MTPPVLWKNLFSGFNSTIFKILLLYVSTSAVFLGLFLYFYYQQKLDSMRLQQMIQMRSQYNLIVSNIVTNWLDTGWINSTKPINAIIVEDLNALSEQVNTPFMVVNGENDILFNTIDEDPTPILEAFKKIKGKKESYLLTQQDSFFIDFNRAEFITKALENPPINLPRIPKPLRKVFKNLDIKIILQGQLIDNNIWLPPTLSNQEITDTNTNETFSSVLNDIKEELWELRFQVLGFLVLFLALIATIAFFLVKLSFRPVVEKFNTLNNFIKDTTHEINTPLSVILMSAQKFEQSQLTEANAKRLKHIKLAAQNLHQVYQNLIAFNFEDSKAPTTQIDLSALIQQRVEYFTPLMAQKSLTHTLHLQPSTLQARVEDMVILLDNLLSNAIKYNKKGGDITITLKMGYLSIKDSGCGIESAEVEKIFERFRRFNNHQGGFGIGLSLVKNICNRYNIKISCKSELKKGSEFILEW